MVKKVKELIDGVFDPRESRQDLKVADAAAQYEAMGERGPARQAEFQVFEALLQIFAAFGATMHGNAGGLVDDQHHPVAMQQAGNDLFRVHGLEAI